LNALQARYFFEDFDIQTKNDIFLDSIDVKSASVVTKWSQEFFKNFYLLRLRGSVSSGSGIFGFREVAFNKHCNGKPYFALLAYM